jgi:TonB-dependent receptor
MKNFTKSTLATLITALLSGQALAADAAPLAPAESKKIESKQEIQAEKDNVLEVIEVTGFIDSLNRADIYKKNADTFLDAISAEDVGELPADNIGDALFGLPGVDMNFSDGEATDIIIGGMPGEFNQLQVNGANVPGFGGEGQSSLSGFSTAMVAGIEVIKSGTASADEGALGGTIKIKNWRPLSFKETRFQVGATAVHHENTEETDGQYNFLYGDRSSDEKFGWVLGGTLENKTTGSETAILSNGWRNQDIDPDQAGKETLIPNQTSYKMNKTQIERNNLLLGLQYQLDDFDFGFNYNYTKFDRVIQQDNMKMAGSTGAKWSPREMLVLEPWSTGENDEITQIARAGIFLTNDGRTKGAWTNMDRNALSQVEENHNAKFDITWFASDNWVVAAQLGYGNSTSGFDPSVVTKSGFRNRESVLWDTRGDLPTFLNINRDAASILYNGGQPGGAENLKASEEFGGFDINDTSTWDIITGGLDGQALDPRNVEVRRINSSTRADESENVFAQLDFTYYSDFEYLDAVKFGVKYNGLSVDRKQGDPNSPQMKWSSGGWNKLLNLADIPSHGTTGEDFFGGGLVAPGSWITVDPDELRNAAIGSGTRDADGNVVWPGIGLDSWLNYYNAGKTFHRDFDSLAAYVQADFSSDRISGNVGVRFVQDDMTVTGYSEHDKYGDAYQQLPFFNEDGSPMYPGGLGYPSHSSMFISPTENPGLDSYVDENILDHLTNLDYWQKNKFSSKENYALPSFNIRYSLTDDDDMFLRFAASRSMARQPMKYTSAGVTLRLPGDASEGFEDNDVVSLTRENPTMEPTMANAASLGFEWYYAKASSLTLAYNHKNISNMRTQYQVRYEPGMYNDEDGLIPQEYSDLPVILKLREANGGGDINTTELGLKHRFSHFDGWLGNTGITFNYTYTDSNISSPLKIINNAGDVTSGGNVKMPSAAKNAFNTQVYYQGDKLTVRLAYNYRDSRLKNRSTLAQKDSSSTVQEFKAAQYSDYVRNLDFALNYKVTKNLKMNFNVTNITDNDKVVTLADGTAVSTIRNGRQYKLSALYQF